MERNQTIGFSLMAVIFLVYFLFFAPKDVPQNKTPGKGDTTNVAVKPVEEKAIIEDTNKAVTSTEIGNKYIVETDKLFLTFNSKGGALTEVKFKEFQTSESYENGNRGDDLVLFDEITSSIQTKVGDLDISNTSFSTNLSEKTVLTGEETKKITFSANGITQTYTIKGNDYVLDYNLSGSKISSPVSYEWNESYKKIEEDLTMSYQKSSINYLTTEGDFTEYGEGEKDSDLEEIEDNVKWVANKQRFFTTAIIPTQEIKDLVLKAKIENTLPGTFKEVKSTFSITPENNQISYKLFIGPNDYDILDAVTDDFERNIYLGWTIFRWMNVGIVVPIFNVITSFVSNYGLAILLLVFIIKMLLFPIAYKSYLSMAKMKELKPEMDAIKEKHGDNATASQQETMKLYGEVGVNPLSGCIPPLLQMPVLLALFNFFPNWFEFRQESFLFAHDLSTCDRIITFEPFLFESFDHISIFTLLMTLSTLAYTYYNNKFTSSAQMQGPMKTMTYLMPLIFFFVLNSYSAGLTFYYFVSNIITISQQLIATSFIDKDKIRAKMEENRKKRKAGDKSGKKSVMERFTDAAKQRVEEAQAQQNN